jgi:endonuclease III
LANEIPRTRSSFHLPFRLWIAVQTPYAHVIVTGLERTARDNGPGGAMPEEKADKKADKKDRIGAKDLGIDLSGNDDSETFRWLAACLLFATRIKQELAADGFAALNKAKLLTPRKLAKADGRRIVDLLGESGYRRYDETKAGELIKLGQDVLKRYGGSITRLPEGAETAEEIRSRLQEFTGIGPTATDIFLRDVGSVWKP